MNQRLLTRIREAVLAGRHRFTEHAFEELHADNLTTVDAEAAILAGELTRIQEQSVPSEPGPRYTLIGTASDLATPIGVICRFEPDDQLIIITCYEVK